MAPLTAIPGSALAILLFTAACVFCSVVLQRSNLVHSQKPRRLRISQLGSTIQRAGLSRLLRSQGKLLGRRRRVQRKPDPMLATLERWRLRRQQLLHPAWNRQLSAPGALRPHFRRSNNDYYNSASVGYALQVTNVTVTC